MVIPREAGRITYSSNIRAMKRVKLDEYQKAVAAGLILGDAHLEANWSKTNYRLGVRHSKDQEQYVRWTYEILKSLVCTPPQYYEHTRSIWFRTISHSELSELHRIFYRDKKKIIPETIAQYLSHPVTMAIWFMDDGNVARQKGDDTCGYHLNTQSFTIAENELLQGTLKSVWNIECTLQKNNGYTRLYILKKSAKKFRSIVEPYIIPELAYKLG